MYQMPGTYGAMKEKADLASSSWNLESGKKRWCREWECRALGQGMAQGASLSGKWPVTINHIPTCGQELAQLRDAGRSSWETPGVELSTDGAQHTAAQSPGEGCL